MKHEKREPKFKVGDIVRETCVEVLREVRGIKNKPDWAGSYLDRKYRYKLAGKYFTVKEKRLKLICKWEDRQDVIEHATRFDHEDDLVAARERVARAREGKS